MHIKALLFIHSFHTTSIAIATEFIYLCICTLSAVLIHSADKYIYGMLPNSVRDRIASLFKCLLKMVIGLKCSVLDLLKYLAFRRKYLKGTDVQVINHV